MTLRMAARGLLATIALLPRLVCRLRSAPSRRIGPAELEQQRRTADAPVILDVRGTDEFVGPLGHILGARNIPVDDVPARMSELTDLRDRPVVLVCRTDRRSARAAEILRAEGFRRVTVLRGGMEAWNAGGRPVERATGSRAHHAEASPA